MQQGVQTRRRMALQRPRIIVSLATALIVGVIAMGLLWKFEIDKRGRQIELERLSKSSVSDFFSSFSSNALVPIVRPATHTVGAVYRTTDGSWIHEPVTCFPKLQAGPPVPSTLPSVTLKQAEKGLIALGLEALVSSSVRADSARSIQLTFSDVTVEAVPEDNLLLTYSPAGCPDLGPIFESVKSGLAPAQPTTPLLVIRELYRAKRKLTVEFASNGDAQAMLLTATALGSAKGQITNSASGQFVLVVENTIPLPVAARPAFLPIPVGIVLGGPAPRSAEQTVWMPLNLELHPEVADVFRALVEPGLGGH
jgi:hypothetical protein